MFGLFPFGGAGFSETASSFFNDSPSDVITLADDGIGAISIVFIRSDSITLIDAELESLSAVTSESDVITILDAGFTGYFDIVSDSIATSDSSQVSYNFLGASLDSLSFVDESIAYGGWNPIPSPNLSWSMVSTGAPETWTRVPSVSAPWNPVSTG